MVPLPTCSFTVFGWLAHDELSGALSACCSRLPSMSFVQARSIFAQSSQLLGHRPLGTEVGPGEAPVFELPGGSSLSASATLDPFWCLRLRVSRWQFVAFGPVRACAVPGPLEAWACRPVFLRFAQVCPKDWACAL